MKMYLIRSVYSGECTIGDLLINHNVFCHTLEDTVRESSAEKVSGATAIPAGVYRIILSQSRRFGRIMPELLDVPGFAGIRIHGGNTAADTHGCILAAANIVDSRTVQGSMEHALTYMLQKHGGEHCVEVIDTCH